MFKIVVICSAALTVSFSTETPPSQPFSSTYMLYTKSNYKSGQKVEATPDSVSPLQINHLTDCAVIVHGHGSSGFHAMSMVLRDAFLTNGTTNVIVVDWAMAANGKQFAMEAVPAIGENIAQLLKLLVQFSKIRVEQLHLVGFDAGAHVVGCTGRILTNVARITALNPIGGENWQLSRNHISSNDAVYVEVIHTEVSTIGLPFALGDVDFFPHGGVRQPGCWNAECNHNRAWQLFAASLTHGGIIGHRCNSIKQALNSIQPCTGFALAMGNNELTKYGSGSYSILTNALYPYRCKVKCGLVDRVLDAIRVMVFENEQVNVVRKPQYY